MTGKHACRHGTFIFPHQEFQVYCLIRKCIRCSFPIILSVFYCSHLNVTFTCNLFLSFLCYSIFCTVYFLMLHIIFNILCIIEKSYMFLKCFKAFHLLHDILYIINKKKLLHLHVLQNISCSLLKNIFSLYIAYAQCNCYLNVRFY